MSVEKANEKLQVLNVAVRSRWLSVALKNKENIQNTTKICHLRKKKLTSLKNLRKKSSELTSVCRVFICQTKRKRKHRWLQK